MVQDNGAAATFARELEALNQRFDDAAAKARELGLSEEAVNAARARQVQAATDQRDLAGLKLVASQQNTLTGFLDNLTYQSASPAERLRLAQASFGQVLGAARGADLRSADLGAVTRAAGTLLEAGRGYYGTGAEGATLEGFVRTSIESLGAPLCAAALVELWLGVSGLASGSTMPLEAQGNEPGVWLAEIGAAADTSGSGPAPLGLLSIGMAPLAAPDRPADLAATLPVVRLSDRGWIGEPGDSLAPNTAYLPRLAEPPALERNLPLYPDPSRRLAVTAGELRLANGDGALDLLAGDWSVAGRRVVLRRGPHRRPLHAAFAEFSLVAELRAAGAASGTSRLAMPLRPAAAELDLPVCVTYAGSGGPEGPSSLKGQFKPLLYGLKRNLEPQAVDPGLLLYQIHDGPIEQVLAVRDRGAALSPGSDHPGYAALASATVAGGSYQTCLALGLLRVGTTPSSLTVDARGDNAAATGGYNTGSAAGIAQKLLRGPGGASGADGGLFAWPVGEVGLALQGGSVAQALEQLASGIFGWWGSDSSGAYQDGQLAAPEEAAPSLTIEPWMLAAPPEEIGPLRAPWWRARVGYQALGRTQADEQLAGVVTATERAYYGQAWRSAVAVDSGISASYPLAEDGPELVSGFELEADAQSLADRLLTIFGRPRRLFLARLRVGAGGYAWPTLQLGTCLALRWPQHRALAAGRPMIVQGVSARGDATTLTLWG